MDVIAQLRNEVEQLTARIERLERDARPPTTPEELYGDGGLIPRYSHQLALEKAENSRLRARVAELEGRAK